MGSRSLVICDQETGYAAAFAAFLMKKKELAFQVQVCDSLAQVIKIQQKTPINILFIGSNYLKEERRELLAEHIFLLTDCREDEGNQQEIPIYKYQSGEVILAEMILKCSEEYNTEDIFLQAAGKRRIRMIGIFSPVHRCGKTGYGLELGRRLANSFSVLYLNMEIYGGIGGYFPEDGQTLADALYYSRQESRNLGYILPTLVWHREGLDYLLPVRVSEDIKGVSLQEWAGLIKQIEEDSGYDVLVLDIDEGIRDVYGILRMCTEVHVPVTDDKAAKAKLSQFEEELHILGYEDVKHKLIKKELRI